LQRQYGVGLRFGRYTLIKKLAVGGMAEIWLARLTGVGGFNRLIAIKRVLGHFCDEAQFEEMFLEEARVGAALTHPNIVQVYDLGKADGAYFMAMELVLGETLAAISWRGKKHERPISLGIAARIIADVAKALDYAHRVRTPTGAPMDLVHRDISPQNILVTYEGEVKLIDFGIAKSTAAPDHTQGGLLKGKLSYMSPEQCRGDPLDRRCDVFALGVVMYELCTGKRLFKHDSELMVLDMITQRRIPPPSEVMDGFPVELEDIVMRALEKDRSRRFATALDLHLALEGYLRSQDLSVTTAHVAEHMRALFEDRIEEKRQLCETAMAPPPSPPPVVMRPPPSMPRGYAIPTRPAPSTSQIHVNGVLRDPSQDFGRTPVAAPFTGQMLDVRPERDLSWVPWLIIGLAVLVIAAAIAILVLAPSPLPR